MMTTLKQGMFSCVSMFPECCLLPEKFSTELTVEVVVETEESYHLGIYGTTVNISDFCIQNIPLVTRYEWSVTEI